MHHDWPSPRRWQAGRWFFDHLPRTVAVQAVRAVIRTFVDRWSTSSVDGADSR